MEYKFNKIHKEILKEILDGESQLVVMDSSIRSGKTLICIMGTILYAMEKVPKGNMIAIMGFSSTSLSQNVDIYVRNICDDLGIKISRSPIKGCLRLTNTNGHYVEMVYFSAKDSASFKGIQGKTIKDSIIFCDEVTLFNEEAFNQALARVTGHSKIILTCNPDRANHWVKERFIDKPKDLKISRFHLTLRDNPSNSEEDIKRFENLYTGTFYRRYILGEWCTSDNLVFPMFCDDNIVDYRGKQAGKTVIGSDYGATDPTTALKVVFTEKKILVTSEFVYQSDAEMGIPDLSPDQLARKVKLWLKENGILNSPVFYDPSAKHWGLSLKNNGIDVRQANNTILAKTDKVGQMVGITLMQSLFSNKKIVISPDCDRLIQELYNWQWDETKANTPEKGGDHCIDALRYALNSNYGIANKILLTQ